MNCDDLTHEQAMALNTALFPGVNFLVRLKTRMQKAGFPQNDKVYQLVCEAYEASWRLSHELHYRSCDGVYRVPKETDAANKEPSKIECDPTAATPPK